MAVVFLRHLVIFTAPADVVLFGTLTLAPELTGRVTIGPVSP